MIMLICSLITLFRPSTDTLLVGSYTVQGNTGIELIQTSTGQKISEISVPQASYQILTRDGKYLFSVSEQVNNQGSVFSFKKSPKGNWEKINQQLTEGDAPCHINFRTKSQTLYTANYMGGSVSVFQTKQGKIEPISQKLGFVSSGKYPQQTSSHSHMVVLSKDENELHISDLGGDKIYHYKVKPDGSLEDKYSLTQFPAGTGPRHFVFSPNEKWVYVVGELSGTVDVYENQGTKWEFVQREILDLSGGEGPKASADIHLSPNGKWLVASNRITRNSLVIYKVEANGRIKFQHEVMVGKVPRNFQFDKLGTKIYVACKDENRIQQFSFNPETGEMKDENKDIVVKSPVAILQVGH
jgi:6-phosphogluconolactonase (cycloisomerase 2 family)